MKKLLSIIALAAISYTASAQEKADAKQHKQPMEKGSHKQGDRHHGHKMMKDMNFSDAQKSQLKANREDYKKKVALLKQDQHITLKAYNEKKAQLQKEQKSKMQGILTPEQKSKMAEMKAKGEQARSEKRAKHFEAMKTKLALTNDQATKLKAQQETTVNSMKAIKANESLSREQKMEQVKKLKENAAEQRKSILTADQLKKMDDMKKDRQKNWKETKK